MAARGEALANAGRCEEAANVFREAAVGEEAKERTRLLRRAAEQLLFGGQIDEAREIIGLELRAAGFPLAGSPLSAMVSLLVHRAYLRFRSLEVRNNGRPSAAPEQVTLLRHIYKVSVGLGGVDAFIGGEMATRFMLRALGVGDRGLIARGVCLIAGHGTIEAPTSRRTRLLLERMAAHGEHLGDREVDSAMYTVRGFQGYFAGDWRRGLGHLDAADKILTEECHGLVWELWSGRTLALWCLFFLGEWRELERRVSAGFREACEVGNVYAMQGMCASYGITAWLARGDVERARQTLEEVISRWRVRGFQFQYLWFLIADCFILLFSGKGSEAWAQLNGRWGVIANSAFTLRFPMLGLQVLHLRGSCALAAAEQTLSDERRVLLREAARAANRLERVKLAHARPLAELLRGGIAAQSGRMADATHHLEVAVQGLERREMLAYAAAARLRLARLKGESPPTFLAGEEVLDPEAITRMLVPGFPEGDASFGPSA